MENLLENVRDAMDLHTRFNDIIIQMKKKKGRKSSVNNHSYLLRNDETTMFYHLIIYLPEQKTLQNTVHMFLFKLNFRNLFGSSIRQIQLRSCVSDVGNHEGDDGVGGADDKDDGHPVVTNAGYQKDEVK